MANRIITATVTGETIKLSNKTAGAAGSFNAVSLSLTFDSAWDGTTKKLYFFDAYGNNAVYRLLTTDLLVDGAYIVPIPAEPLAYAGEMTITIRGIDFATDGTTAERIIMSASTTMKVLSAIAPASDVAPIEPTPTQAEQLLASVNSVTGMTASATNLPTGQPATVTKTTNGNGTINLAFGLPAGGKGDTGIQGVKGDKGDTGNSVEYVWNGTQLGIRIEGQANYVYVDLKGDTGATGATGPQGERGLQGERGETGAKGDKGDTGNTGATGNGIASVARTSGTGAPGTTDTYTITFTDSTTTTFGVYNGANGTGAGDMLAATYDPNSKNADAFSMANMVEGTTNKIFTATERTKLSGIADNANNYIHPSTHSADIVVDGTTNKAYTATEKTKLAGIAESANNYTHPANHPPSIITQDASNRFVTDTEKAEWNGKANPPTAVTATLSTTWAGSGPYTQSVTVSGVTSTNNITVSLASTADEAQRNAARDALLSATAQATNSITVTADGDKPTVALPIQVLILGG